jgi:hypothetical protein
MDRHRIRKGTVAVENVSRIPFFRWRKNCHKMSPGIVARVQNQHNWIKNRQLEIFIDFGRFARMIALPRYASHDICSG